MEKVLILDASGISASFALSLESLINAQISLFRDVSVAKQDLNDFYYSLGIVNPYLDFGGFIKSHAKFIKEDLKERKIPVLVFSRVSSERLSSNSDLSLLEGVDYSSYLRKPAKIDELAETILKLIYQT